ncbi:hypothetical protein HK103_001748 [Boothiomyces macroporosus]|uniref:Uncharacterized protein n=1 Tax=Boothiomyces macroporosus TaxID=261099 RepID=A0AAD5UNU2_9FUNG|nr:hypothetical protein HK103_001748 [Boothiomyces macroporosus]
MDSPSTFDEGFEAEPFQIKDARTSETIQNFSKRRNSTSSVIDKYGRRESYRDQDSVLHYFVATNQSEELLDRYISTLITRFLNDPSPIYAIDWGSNVPDFKNTKIPVADSNSLSKYLLDLKENLVDKSTRTAAPQMIGHMTAALPYFHRPLSKLLTALNQNVVKVETASTFTALERQTIAMLHNTFYARDLNFYDAYTQCPSVSLGVVCSGGTIANITAMWIARNKALGPDRDFPGISKAGLVEAMNHYKYSGAVIIGSELMHYSFKKAADLLGLGENGLCLIPTNDDYQMRTDILTEKVKEYQSKNILVIAIVAIAGTTETGSIDPIHEIVHIGFKHDVHVHVDAAWGGPLIFSNEHGRKLSGIDKADSITVDGHKQLYTPLGIGILLLKSPASTSYIRKTAAYVIRQDSPDLGKYTLEGSRPANALYLHASLNLLGQEGLSILMTRSCTLVKQMSVRLNEHPSNAFQTFHNPQTNILLYRYIPSWMRNKEFSEDDLAVMNQFVQRIQKIQSGKQDGQPHPFTSRTTVMFKSHRTDAFRIVIANPLTQWQDIELLINDQIRVGKIVEKQFQHELKVKRFQQENHIDGWWPGWPYDI